MEPYSRSQTRRGASRLLATYIPPSNGLTTNRPPESMGGEGAVCMCTLRMWVGISLHVHMTDTKGLQCRGPLRWRKFLLQGTASVVTHTHRVTRLHGGGQEPCSDRTAPARPRGTLRSLPVAGFRISEENVGICEGFPRE